MATIYYDRDASAQDLQGKRIAVLGYGSQGHAQAQNLKESGLDVVVGLHPASRSRRQAEADGLQVFTPAEAAAQAQVIQLLMPDHVQPRVYYDDVEPNLEPGDALVFSHGFNIHFHQIVPPDNVDVFMVAPKGPGHIVRRMYVEGQGVPGLVAVEQDATGKALDVALAYAQGIGCTRAGVIATTFQEETETDLFGEQAVLCGGITELIKAGFDTLVEAGYQPEIAYFECANEVKLIVDLIYEGGLSGMRYSVSDTAEFGDYMAGRRIITEETREEMRRLLGEVQSGEFARSWILENQANRPFFRRRALQEAQHPLEKVGARLREMMPWLKK